MSPYIIGMNHLDRNTLPIDHMKHLTMDINPHHIDQVILTCGNKDNTEGIFTEEVTEAPPWRGNRRTRGGVIIIMVPPLLSATTTLQVTYLSGEEYGLESGPSPHRGPNYEGKNTNYHQGPPPQVTLTYNGGNN